MGVFGQAPRQEAPPQRPRRDQIVQDMPGGITKDTAASAGQVLDFDLFLGRHAADLV
jgi:hypothetical protein